MTNYEVSVVAIAHNQEAFIERAIKSLIEQDFSLPYEIIIVNDSSTDETENIIKSLIQKHENIRLINVSYRAPGLTRIEGIKASKGKYITFLDGDDYYRHDMISKLYDTITKNDADVVNCSHYYIRKKRIKTNLSYTHVVENAFKKKVILDKKEALDAYFQDIYFFSFMWSKMFKGDLLRSVEFHLPKYNVMFEDIIMCFDILMKCNKVISIKDCLYYYDKTNQNAATNTAKDRAQGHVNVFALIRHLIDLENDVTILKLWRKHKLRRKFSLLADIVLSRKYLKGATKIKKIREQLKLINNKGVLNIENQLFSEFILNCLY